MRKILYVSSLLFLILAASSAVFVRNIQAASAPDEGDIQSYADYQSISLDYQAQKNSWQVDLPDPIVLFEKPQTNEYGLLTPGVLSEDEIEGLLFMREEEKLACDVYNTLFSIWDQPIFQNIAGSEQTHMDSLKILIDRYNLNDPAPAEPGSFSNPNLQALYDELIARGSLSLVEALEVGVLIEEKDIVDLQAHLSQTDNPDIQRVYNNLLRGSQNHLGAFTRILQKLTNQAYQPQNLTQQTAQANNSQFNQGRGYRGGGN